MKKTLWIVAVRWVASASGQCSCPHSIECASVSHKKRDDNGFAPPCSPDLAPCDFLLFPRMKRDFKGKRFQNVEEVRGKTTEALKASKHKHQEWKEGHRSGRWWRVTLHFQTCSGPNHIIPLMRRPNTDNTPNKPVTLPRDQLLLHYVVTSPVHTVTIRGNVTLWTHL